VQDEWLRGERKIALELDRLRWRDRLLIGETSDRIGDAYQENESHDFEQRRRSRDGHVKSFRTHFKVTALRSRLPRVGNP
jgi:hypothetical protein